MPLAADQDVGVRDGAARLGAEPVQPVRTDADDESQFTTGRPRGR